MTDSVNTRELALGILMEVTEGGSHSHLLLRAVLSKYQYMDKRDRAFLTRLVEGTLKQLIELDYILDRFSSVKTKNMKPVIRNILRMGVYQLRYMDSVPASAACNESVKLARRKGFARLIGFVNGVLRSVARDAEGVTWPDAEQEPVRARSVRYSMPEWIVAQWLDGYGAARTDQMLAASQTKAPLAIRTNTARITPEELRVRLEAEGVHVDPVRLHMENDLPYAFYLSNVDYLNGLSSFREGLFYVQDVSSMLVAEYADPKPGDRCVDVCGAPGGKGLHLAEKLLKLSEDAGTRSEHGAGSVEIRDLTPEKVALVGENIRRCRLPNVTAKQWDATVPDPSLTGRADLVIADLPCSGLGVLRRKAEIRYRITEDQQDGLVQLQRKILATVSSYVTPGGALVYSTCTVHRAENEDNTQWFLDNHSDFTLAAERQIFPGEDGDGFYIARLIRQSA